MVPFKNLIKVAVVIFCVWHISAIGITAYADTVRGKAPQWIALHIRQPFRNYLELAFDQKQSWRAFSSPGRTVTHFFIDGQDDQKQWKEIVALNPESLNWRRQSSNLKLILNLSDGKKSRKKFLNAYLLSYCQKFDIKTGNYLRLRKRWYVIPKKEIESTDWWKTWEPKWREEVISAVHCTTPPAQ